MDYLSMAQERFEETKAIFRALHRIPEPSHGEVKTNALIRRELNERGIPYLAPADNITIAVIEGGKAGKTIGVRCDTDALQLEERTTLSYRSEHPGMMHACGHDAHITAGLSAAFILWDARADLAGTAKIIFQPAEEGEKGALEVIATGLVDDVDAFFAIHVNPEHPTGTLLCSPGPVCACADMFKITITGKGGHGAAPHLCVDPIAAGAAVVQSLQHVVSRFTDPVEPVVLSVCSFHAGTRCNIIAEEVLIEGTFRSFNARAHNELVGHAERVIENIAAAHGCSASFSHDVINPAVINDGALAALALKSAETIAPDGLFAVQRKLMLGDDFSDYSDIAPGCYAQVGVRNEEKGLTSMLHHALFVVDEDALPIMAAWMCQFVEDAGRE